MNTIKSKFKLSTAVVVSALCFGGFSNSVFGDDADLNVMKAQLKSLEETRDTLGEIDDPKEGVEKQIDELDEKIDSLQERIEQNEDAREDAADDREDLYKGNANQTRDWIKAESEGVRDRLVKAVEQLEEAEEKCHSEVKAADNKDGSFTEEQMKAHVAQFETKATMILGVLDHDFQNMLYTYESMEEMKANKKTVGERKKMMKKSDVDESKDAEATVVETTTPESAKKDTNVTDEEEDAYDENQNMAIEQIEKKADSIQKRLGKASDKIEELEKTHIDYAYAALEKNSKFPYSWKRTYLNKFKEDAADVLVSVRKDMCEMLPHAESLWKDATTKVK